MLTLAQGWNRKVFIVLESGFFMNKWLKRSTWATLFIAGGVFAYPAIPSAISHVKDAMGYTPAQQVKTGTYEGFTTKIRDYGVRSISIEDGDARITAKDYPENGFGRFDEINLGHVPRGHPLERLANVNSLELAYRAVDKKK